MPWVWTGGGQEGYMNWVEPVSPVSYTAPAAVSSASGTSIPAASAPAPAPTVEASVGGPGMFEPRRLRGGGQEQPGPAGFDSTLYPVVRGNPQGDSLQFRTPEYVRNSDFTDARSALLYNQDPSRALALMQDPAFAMTQAEFDSWFSEEALMKEIDRLINYPRHPWSPFGADNFLTEFMEHEPLGSFEPYFGGGTQPLDYLANPALMSMDNDSKDFQHLRDVGRVGGRIMGGYGVAAGVGAAAAPAVNAAAGMLTGGDPRMAALNLAMGYGDVPATGEGVPAVNNAQVADSGQIMTDVYGPMMPPAIPEADPTFGGMLSQSGPGEFSVPPSPGSTSMPAAVPEADPTFGGMLAESEPGVYAPPAPSTAPTPQQIQRYAKIAKTVYDTIGNGESNREGQPQDPGPDATEEEVAQYAEGMASYLGLDAQTMAAAGLQPGSPEYMEYILQQADAIISQVMEGIDVDTVDLAQQLRAKSQAEIEHLQRALYVRGQMGQRMGQGTYTDPFTGKGEEVIGAGEFNPGVAAYQRGLAGQVDALGNLRGKAAFDQLQGMLGRDVDLYGMQARQDEEFERAKLEETDRRRRMYGG
jgi:hypothetical protein